jgi:hypothetical protein
MNKTMLAGLLAGLLGMQTTSFNARKASMAFDDGFRMPTVKKPSATYGKHTCVSSKVEISQHNQLVNTRQVRRLRVRKPDHPSVASYG